MWIFLAFNIIESLEKQEDSTGNFKRKNLQAVTASVNSIEVR